MQSRITEILGIDYPIFQGGMAWVADASLASAVSNAGGLGIIAGGNAPREVVEKEINIAKELTDKPFGVNVMLLSPFAEDIVDLVCESGIKIITTGAGNPGKYMERFKSLGIKVIPVVPSVALARRMEKVGADAVIVEGMEAGGHIGKLTTMSIVPQVVSAVGIPVIAAGGIGDGRGLAASFMLGAEGVQLGTRFLLAKECTVHQNYKEAVKKAKDIDTVISSQFFGHQVRVLRNKLSREFDALEREELTKTEPDESIFDEFGKGRLKMAVVDGDVAEGSLMAGQIAGMVNEEATAEEIIQSLMTEAEEVIKKNYEKWCE